MSSIVYVANLPADVRSAEVSGNEGIMIFRKHPCTGNPTSSCKRPCIDKMLMHAVPARSATCSAALTLMGLWQTAVPMLACHACSRLHPTFWTPLSPSIPAGGYLSPLWEDQERRCEVIQQWYDPDFVEPCSTRLS